MSVYASRWAIDHLARPDCRLSPTARAVLLVLAAEANYRTGYATAGRRRLAALLGVHPDTTYRAVRELRRWAPLAVTDVAGKGIRWHFPTSPDVESGGAEVVHTGRVDAPPPVIHTGRADAMGGRAHAARGAAPTRPKGSGSTDVDKKGAPATVPAMTGGGVGVPLTGSMSVDRIRAILEREAARERARIAGAIAE